MKKYQIIYADPPWEYKLEGGLKSARGFGSQRYGEMTLDCLGRIPLFSIADKDCTLFLWCVFPEIQ